MGTGKPMLGGIAVLVLVWDGLITCSVFDGHISLRVCCGRRLRLASSWLGTLRVWQLRSLTRGFAFPGVFICFSLPCKKQRW